MAERPADRLAETVSGLLSGERTPPPEPRIRLPGLDQARRRLVQARDRLDPVVEEGATLAFLKRLVLRVARVFTRPQSEYNILVAEALGEVIESAELLAAELTEERSRSRRLLERLSVTQTRIGDEARLRDQADQHLDTAVSEVAAHVGRVEAALTAEQSSRSDLASRLDVIVDRVERGTGTELLAEVERLRALQALDRRRVEALAASPRRAESAPVAEVVRASRALPESAYFDFEDRHRGSEEEIRHRQRGYAGFFAGLKAVVDGLPILDAGCGRGELLEVLRDAGLAARGVDSNGAMVARCLEKDLEVDQADLFVHLDAISDGALGGFVAAQVVEHLTIGQIVDLLELVQRKLAPGAGLILETINPESIYAMKFFWHDPTHVRPIPAATLEALVRAAGLASVQVRWMSPVPAAVRPEVEPGSGLARLDQAVFGDQDYALHAEKLA